MKALAVANMYKSAKETVSDINEHVETLHNYAKLCSSVLECGVRTGVSTWGFSQGLLENNLLTKRLVSCDLYRDPSFNIRELLLKSLLDFRFWIGSDLDYPDDEEFDIIFIDTWHIYGQLKRELKKFAPMCNKWIIMHDTTVDAIHGETIRLGQNANEASTRSGFPIEEITKGLWPAVEEFLAENKNFTLRHRYTHNNGLTILERVSTDIKITVPEPIIPESIIPKDIIPEPIIPKDIIPESIIPKDIIPKDIVPKEISYSYGIENITKHSWGEGAELKIGSFCSIATNCHVFLGGNHRTDYITTYPFGFIHEDVFDSVKSRGHPATKGNVVIGNDVWIAANVTIMSGVTVGDGAVIACNSHVVKDVAPYSMVGGNPARLIRYRFSDDIIAKLLKLQWWNLPVSVIKKIIPLLMSNNIEENLSTINAIVSCT
jgi:acetyltransferase-like isoleucine patch superfamily enzyme